MTEANGPSDGFTVESKNTGRNHVVTFLKRQKKKKSLMCCQLLVQKHQREAFRQQCQVRCIYFMTVTGRNCLSLRHHFIITGKVSPFFSSAIGEKCYLELLHRVPFILLLFDGE